MTYSGSTGDVNAFGNVVVTKVIAHYQLIVSLVIQKPQSIELLMVHIAILEDGGKTKDLTGDVYDPIVLAINILMQVIHKAGLDPYYVKGQNLSYDGQTGSIEKGMITSTAMAFKHTPDYRIEGEDIKIYPGDKV